MRLKMFNKYTKYIKKVRVTNMFYGRTIHLMIIMIWPKS